MSDLTREDLDIAFAPFHPDGAWLPIDAQRTRYRKVTSDEFMLMSKDEDGTYWLKHRATRNYVMVFGGRVRVPTVGGEFLHGYFGAAPEPLPPLPEDA